MRVTLVDSTTDAAEKLIFAKATRLRMTPGGLDDIMKWDEETKNNELRYISKTIKSSWEFVSYSFLLEGVSRAFTHQFVRNRQGSYAQQTMRLLDASEFQYITGPSIEKDPLLRIQYDLAMEQINNAYEDLIDGGAEIEDARGILPTNISTNIMVKYNLRTLAELVSSRSSPRTQVEFRQVLEAMKEAVLEVHPWADMFLCDQKTSAACELDKAIEANFIGNEKTDLIKLIDILRR